MQHSEADGGLAGLEGKEAGALFRSRVGPRGKPSGQKHQEVGNLAGEGPFPPVLFPVLGAEDPAPHPPPTPVTCTLGWVVSDSGLGQEEGSHFRGPRESPFRPFQARGTWGKARKGEASKAHREEAKGDEQHGGSAPGSVLWGRPADTATVSLCWGQTVLSLQSQQQPAYAPHSLRLYLHIYL